MYKDSFFINNNMTPRLEDYLHNMKSFDEFVAKFSDEFLNDDHRVGNYLRDLIDNCYCQ